MSRSTFLGSRKDVIFDLGVRTNWGRNMAVSLSEHEREKNVIKEDLKKKKCLKGNFIVFYDYTGAKNTGQAMPIPYTSPEAVM